MNKKEKALQREYRSAVRMMIAARHEAEHGRHKKALWMIHKAWGTWLKQIEVEELNVIEEIYFGEREMGDETRKALLAYNEAVGEDRRFLKWRKNR